MDAKTEAELEASVAALTSLYKARQIEPKDYYKGMLSIAYNYCTEGDKLRAASIAQGIPRDYYESVHRQQMTEDPNFSYVSYSLALELLHAGYVSLTGPTPASTMKAASA